MCTPGTDRPERAAVALWGHHEKRDPGETGRTGKPRQVHCRCPPACFAIFGLRDEKFYVEDCCAATSNLIHGLWAYGVASCWIAGDKMDYNEAVRELMKVPPEYTLVSLIPPAGYPAMGEKMVPPKKKTFDDVTFKDTYLD